MDDAQVRERVLQWVGEAREVLDLVPQLLENGRTSSARSEQAERESEALRRELTELRKELAESRDQLATVSREHGDLQRRLDDLRRQNDVLRSEKDEAAQALARVLETVQQTNQVAMKLGVTRSPFARAPHAQPPAPATAPPE